jgi:hypothetical protein
MDIVPRIAPEKDIVPRIALKKAPYAKKRASKVISAPESAPRLAHGFNLYRSSWTLRQKSTGEMIHTHPLSAGCFPFYSYTRQAGVFA